VLRRESEYKNENEKENMKRREEKNKKCVFGFGIKF